MGMVVRTNTMALNAYRQLGLNNNAVSKSLEKLSSGFRINRAGDDASGLAISEKMKAQIAGLETASSNAQDGISLIQTAEGALTEVHSMLNRMVELATKSANGTYQDAVDREAIQAEVDALLEEIDRIGNGTNFNGIDLLNGNMDVNEGVTIGASTDAVKAGTKTGADAIKEAFEGANVSATHFNTGAAATEAKPVFTVDLADFKVEQVADNAATGKVEFGLTIGGQNVTFVADAAADAATGVKWEKEADDNATDLSLAASDIITAGDFGTSIKHAVIGSEVYELSATDSKLTFTWVGKAVNDGTDTKLDDTAKVDDATVALNPKGNFEFTATKRAGNAITETGRENCHVTTITDAVKEGTVNRGGASLKLTEEMVKSGNKLVIGTTEFTFDDTVAAADATGNTIGTKGLTGADLLRSITEQLSSKTATVEKDDEEYTFDIGRGNGYDTIEIEEQKQTDPADLGAFTEDEMKNVFGVTTQAANASTEITLSQNPVKDSKITIGGKTYTFKETPEDGEDPLGANDIEIGDTAKDTAANLLAKLQEAGYADSTANGATITIRAAAAKDKAPVVSNGGLTLQIGDTGADYNMLQVKVNDMRAKALGLEGLDVSSAAAARKSIDTIKAAINKVSTNRANMGALQNRLEHTINNLDVAVENLSAANSRIRDTDMAKEMMNYTKMNVLVQSAQAMLAQANQQPQSVLQLLQ